MMATSANGYLKKTRGKTQWRAVAAKNNHLNGSNSKWTFILAEKPPSWRKRKSRNLAGSGMTAILALILAPEKGSQWPYYATYDKTLRNVLLIQAIYTYNILLLIFDLK